MIENDYIEVYHKNKYIQVFYKQSFIDKMKDKNKQETLLKEKTTNENGKTHGKRFN